MQYHQLSVITFQHRHNS